MKLSSEKLYDSRNKNLQNVPFTEGRFEDFEEGRFEGFSSGSNYDSCEHFRGHIIGIVEFWRTEHHRACGMPLHHTHMIIFQRMQHDGGSVPGYANWSQNEPRKKCPKDSGKMFANLVGT